MDTRSPLQEYFAKRVVCYKEVYSEKRSLSLRNIFYYFGWFPLRRIFGFTMDYLSGKDLKKVLDIGCGTGVYSIELARKGASVTALDSCDEMVGTTRSLLDELKLANSVKIVCADYLAWAGKTNDVYDLALAIGVLDYAENIVEYLTSFHKVSRETIMTFPVRSQTSFLTDLSYRRRGFRGYAYDEEEIKNLLIEAGLEIIHFTKIPPGTYWVHARRTQSENRKSDKG